MKAIGNRVCVSSATTGTGTLTLGSVITGFQSFTAAGIASGTEVSYVIEDVTAWEIGTGVFTSPSTLTRVVLESSNADALLNLSGASKVFLSLNKADLETIITTTKLHSSLKAEESDLFLERKDPGIIIPFYIYPNNPYSDAVCLRLFAALREYAVPAIIIVNPTNGPGTVVDGNYTAFIRLAKAAGAVVVGYVSTDYAVADAEDVTADITTWTELYPEIDGIFLDEQPYDVGPGNTGSAYVDLYKEYTDFAHALGLSPVIANAGSAPQQAWFDTKTADITVVHENTTWPNLVSNWVGGNVDYDASRRAILVYNQATLDPQKIREALRYVRWVYVTHDNLTGGLLNPWDELPAYLEKELIALRDGHIWDAMAIEVLTDTSNITLDLGITINARVTLAGNRTLTNPLNATTVGQSGFIEVIQDATGSRTLAYGSNWYFPNSTPPVLSTAANAVDLLSYLVISPTRIVVSLMPDIGQ